MTPLPRSRRPGFTLVEVLISFGIFTALTAMILMLVIGTNRSLFDSQNKGVIDRNFRTTTSALSKLVSCSDFLYVFKSQTDKVTGAFNPLNPDRQQDLQTPQGLSGDYLVTVYYKNPGRVDPLTGQMDTTVSRIAGICRFPDTAAAGRPGPIYMFDSSVNNWGVAFPRPADSSVDSITALLPTAAKIKGFTKLADAAFSTNTGFDFSKNAVIDPGAGIFVNIGGTGALMLARIRTGMPGKYVSNGYSFSISSRNL